MANINIDNFEERKESGFINPGVLVIIIIFFLVLVTWGGLFYYQKDIDSRISEIESKNTESINKDLLGEKANKVIDLQERLAISNRLLPQGRNLFSIFSEIESSMLPAVYINNYTFDDKTNTIKMICVADNFNTVALQMLSFKKNNDMKDVKLGNAEVDKTTNKLTFDVTLTIL